MANHDVLIIFQDSLNLYAGDLSEFGRAMGLDVEKGECDHKIICRENYE